MSALLGGSIVGVREAILDLSGDTARRQCELLLEQTRVARGAVGFVIDGSAGRVDWASARSSLRGLEHEGDRYRAELVGLLYSTLVSPIDREDMFRLSRSIDDVVDYICGTVRMCDLLGIGRTDRVASMAGGLDDALKTLEIALAALTANRGRAAAFAWTTKKACGVVRRTYDVQIAELLAGAVTPEVLREREVLRRLDVAGLRLAEAVDALADGIVKRNEPATDYLHGPR